MPLRQSTQLQKVFLDNGVLADVAIRGPRTAKGLTGCRPVMLEQKDRASRSRAGRLTDAQCLVGRLTGSKHLPRPPNTLAVIHY